MKKTKYIGLIKLTSLLLCLGLLFLAGCTAGRHIIRSTAEFDIAYDTSRLIKFEIELESGAIIAGQLEPLAAPVTVRNFITLAESGYYNGKSFNYVVADKIVMCSSPEDNPPYNIYGEFSDNGWQNTIGHQRGVLSMGRSDEDYNSAYSSFFILLENRSYYNGSYAAFGEITSGLGNLDAVSQVEVEGTTPVVEQVIKEIRILGN